MYFKIIATDLTALLLYPQQPNSGELDPLYVVEVLLHCSKDSLKNSATESAKPARPDERGEMQVCYMCLFSVVPHKVSQIFISKPFENYDKRGTDVFNEERESVHLTLPS